MVDTMKAFHQGANLDKERRRLVEIGTFKLSPESRERANYAKRKKKDHI